MFAYYVVDFNPFIFRLWGNFGPRWYGLAYVLAFGAAFLVYRYLAQRGYADLRLSQVGDFVVGAAIFGTLLGGRLGYVFFYKPQMLRDPLSILRVWEGGMASHGGMIGILLFSLYYAYRHNLSWTNLGDNLVVGAPIGLFFGRIANFVNGELYGRASSVAWAMQFPKELFENDDQANRAVAECSKVDPSLLTPEAIVDAVRHQPQAKEILRAILTPRHPSQLYEAFFEGLVLFAILWFARTRLRQPNGFLTGLFFVCYAIFRIIVENFREPDATLIAGFTRGQFFSFFLIVIGLGFIIFSRIRPTYPKNMPG